MTIATRSYTFTDGTTAYGSQVETEFNTLYNLFNNLDSASTAWTNVKTASAQVTGVLSLASGSVGTPALNFGDGGTGFYKTSTNQFLISTNGSALIDFRTTQIRVQSGKQFIFDDGSAAAPPMGFASDAGGVTGFYFIATGSFGVTIAGTQRMYWASSAPYTHIGTDSDTSNVNLRINGNTRTGANTGTLTNCPHTGNPTLYLDININGTTYCIPAYATS